MSRQFAYINTHQGISLYIDGENFDLDRSWKGYDSIIRLLKEGVAKADQIKALAQSIIAAVRGIVQNAGLPALRVDGERVLFKDQELPDAASEMILRLYNEGQNLAYLERFFQNLYQNPSFRVVNNLYTFLVQGKMPITDDGHFLAYKAIRQDWKDIHSGKIDNSIGAIVEVPRNKVDEDPNRTCSYGLHVCSYEYLPYFAHADGHVVVCKINPKDVVAIPNDYNNTKMRVARYEVISEVEGYYQRREHVLGASSVVTFNSAPEPTQDENENEDDTVSYDVEVLIDAYWDAEDTFDTRDDAIKAAQRLEDTYRKVRIVKNSLDDSFVIYETDTSNGQAA